MNLFLIVFFVAVGVLVAARLIGRGQGQVLGEFEVLEKRFGLERRASKSRWGKGFGERYSLHGSFRGYPLSIYSHYHRGDGGKVEWTTMALETLFAEELALDIAFPCSQAKARFAAQADDLSLDVLEGVELRSNEAAAGEIIDGSLRRKLAAIAEREVCGAFRLSKGFLEYREVGLVTQPAVRIRYQEALIVLADLADAISVFKADRAKGEG